MLTQSVLLLVWKWIPYREWLLLYERIPMKTEFVESVVLSDEVDWKEI